MLPLRGGAGEEEAEQEDQRGAEPGEEAGKEPAEAPPARFAAFRSLARGCQKSGSLTA